MLLQTDIPSRRAQKALNPEKFQNPDITAKGEKRAFVEFEQLKTLWFMTGSLCNIECVGCYINSSPKNDHFVYLTPEDIVPYLDEIDGADFGRIEVGFTGGEPFINPHILDLMRLVLERGHKLLVLSNAMQPMLRKRVKSGLIDLHKKYGGQICIRVSLDHYQQKQHDEIRGRNSYKTALSSLDWLSENGFDINLAGRTIWGEDESISRAGYARLITNHGWNIDPQNPKQLVLFPEMDDKADVPEITIDCWDILGRKPSDIMCSNARMIARRKGADRPVVLACTLLWDDPQFELGQSLKQSLRPVKLNHPHCARFCVLGGASCS